MLAPILATKLYIPPIRPNAVSRPSLIEMLVGGMQRKLTLISAPAGFGKTSLISEWAAKNDLRIAWVSLDERDNNPPNFLRYIIAALQTVYENVGTNAWEALNSPELPPIETILTALLNEIATIPENFVLVLDDYHVIDSKSVDEVLSFLLDHLPPQMHLIIATREDPDIPLARLRALGQMTELRAADLRFTPSETTEFLNKGLGLNLSTNEISALENRTEGWIAGLQLAAISMQGQKDSATFIKSFTGSHRFVLDYLIEEVLKHQSQNVQDFLLRTSILDNMCGSLCDSVLSDPSIPGQEILEDIEQSNLFIIPLDNERRWYRYHQLFADMLRMHLIAEHPGQVPVLHQRASEWYEQNGLMDSAIRHALAAKDFTRAANLIEVVMPVMNRSQQNATLHDWLKKIPDELVRVRPVLCTGYALVSMSYGEITEVDRRLHDAEKWLGFQVDHLEPGDKFAKEMVVIDKEAFRRVPGMIALIRGARTLAEGNMPETVRHARRVLDFAGKEDYLMLGGASSQMGLAAWAEGNLEEAWKMTSDGLENVRQAGYISSAIGGCPRPCRYTDRPRLPP